MTGLKSKILLFSAVLSVVLPLSAEPAESDQQLLRGMVSVVRSMDTYLKSVYGFDGLVGENSEVNGDLILCEYIAIAEYPAKADGYLRAYARTGEIEYKDLSEEFIDKMYNIYQSTHDVYGRNWMPTQVMAAKDGNIYSYGKGPKFSRYTMHPIPYDQSKGKYAIENSLYPDAWGYGMWELAKMAGYLDDDHRDKLIRLLIGVLGFWDADYMKYRKRGAVLFRTDDVTPSKPQLQSKEPVWSCMGSDYIYSVLALNEINVSTDKYDPVLMAFMQTYIEERANHNGEKRINYLDSRVVDLAGYFAKKEIHQDIAKWVYDHVPSFYSKFDPQVRLMLDGDMEDISSPPLLELYAKLKMKEKFRKLWFDIADKYFDKNGIKMNGKYVTINNSGIVALLDYCYLGWQQRMLTDQEFNDFIKKYYGFKGNSRNYRDLDKWVLESDKSDREAPDWNATPYEGFPEQVESEAYYEGRPQATIVHRKNFGGDPMENAKPENQYRGCYYQFTAPFQPHAEKMRYGLACSFNLVDTFQKGAGEAEFILDKDCLKAKIYYKEADIPGGTPCFGFIDITRFYNNNLRIPDGADYQITDVIRNDGKKPVTVAWQVKHIFDWRQPFSGLNNVKLFFYVENTGDGKVHELLVTARKRNNPYFISESEEKPKIGMVKDLPLAEPTGQENIFDRYVVPDATDNYFMKDIYENWNDWRIAYFTDKTSCKERIETIIKNYRSDENNSGLTKKQIIAQMNGLIRIYSVYDGKLKPDLKNILNRLAEDELSEYYTKDNADDLLFSETMIRFGVLFPECSNAKKSALAGWKKMSDLLKARINEEGYDKEKSPLRILKTIVNIENLCLINNVKISDDVYGTAEKMLEMVMYCSNPNGTISEVLEKSNKNIRQIFYWASKVYKRSDFRFIAFGGLKMEDSIPPIKTSIAFPKSGIYVMRNSWDLKYSKTKCVAEVEQDRQKQMVFDLKNGEFVCYGFNRKLLKMFDACSFKLKKWETDGEKDYLEISDEYGEYSKKITFYKPNYWIFEVESGKEFDQQIDLNCVELVPENNSVRTVNMPPMKLYGQMSAEYRYKGDVKVVTEQPGYFDVKINNTCTLRKAKRFLIYPYVDSERKSTYVRISDSEPVKKTDFVRTMIGKDEVFRQKKVPYVPEVEMKKNKKNECEIIIDKRIDKRI